MNEFYKETDGIYRLCVPFEEIYTSVFLVKTDAGAFLVDTATTAEDVDGCIVPALRKMGYALSDIRTLVLTHKHRDHAGGAKRIAELAPEVSFVSGLCTLAEGVSIYPLRGHTVDSIGVLDERSHTLISGDGLQGAGIYKYRTSLKSPHLYLETLHLIEGDERIENILFSHAYEPWNSDRLFGRKSVLDCLNKCKNYVRS